MIEAIEVRNFKSLVHFTLTGLGPFVCLIGLNGAGKTSLLQALEFLGTCFSDAAGFRDWELSEILSQQTKQRTCEFEVRMRLGEMGVLTWCGVFNVDKRRFMEESVTEDVTGKVLCRLKDRIFSISDTHVSLDVGEFKYYGSIFSLYRFDKHPALAALGKAFRSLRSLGLLSPESMRGATRWVREMGLGGEGFAGFLSTLPKDDLEALQERLKRFYPDFVRMDFKRKRAGWIRLCMEERSNGDATSFGRTELRHVNDGFLRLTALLAQRFSEDRILLFDEVENGFNQELVGRLAETLWDGEWFGQKQVIVTTHSALLLNYLPDEVAERSVFLLYRDKARQTRGCPFFTLPEAHRLLEDMAPGQVMSEINLEELSARVATENAHV